MRRSAAKSIHSATRNRLLEQQLEQQQRRVKKLLSKQTAIVKGVGSGACEQGCKGCFAGGGALLLLLHYASMLCASNEIFSSTKLFQAYFREPSTTNLTILFFFSFPFYIFTGCTKVSDVGLVAAVSGCGSSLKSLHLNKCDKITVICF